MITQVISGRASVHSQTVGIESTSLLPTEQIPLPFRVTGPWSVNKTHRLKKSEGYLLVLEFSDYMLNLSLGIREIGLAQGLSWQTELLTPRPVWG